MEKNIQNNKPASTPNNNLPTVLIVEDDVALNRLMRMTLEREGFKTNAVINGAEALSAARTTDEAIILLDYRLPDMNAKQVISALKEERINAPVIITTGNGDERIAVDLMKMGVRDYIVKEPAFLDKLPKIIRQTIDATIKEKELAQSEAALRESEEKFRKVFFTCPDLISINRLSDGMFVSVNKGFEQLSGYSEKEVVGKTSLELNIWKNPDDRKTVVEALKKHGLIENFETHFITKNGNIVDGLMSATIIEIDGITHIVNISRDVTERKLAEKKQKQLEEQLRQSQKLEAIGQLSSGVAHDFNNLLGGIMGHAELLRMRLSEGSDLLRHAASIISSCVKAADLTKQLLTFARKAPVEFKRIEMNSFIKEAVGIMERTIDRRVEIAVTTQKEPAFISGDRNQLENALLNIAINARDAMPEGGKLSIISETVDLDKNALANEHFEVVEGKYLRIIVEDTGTGMSNAIKNRIFEPFFTTKVAGKGTGLGLASVYGCVKQHNGYIIVDSHLGIGTQFNIYLPVIKSTGPVDGVKKEAALNPGKGGLLVVDDEAVYGDILKEIFGELGYTVHCCMNGAEAVAFYRDHFSAIQVVILDMNMPKMNGLDCFRRLKEINANVKVIVSTGYGENKDRATLQTEGVRAFVQKPYRTAELANKIKELIQTPPGPP